MYATMAPGSTGLLSTSCSLRSSACMRPANFRAMALASRVSSESWRVWAGACGPKPQSAAVPVSTFRCPARRRDWNNSMNRKILLVEDNEDDEKLTLRALKKSNITNAVVIARDGAEALDLLIGDGAETFGLVLLDLRLPKVPGLEVLARIRSDPRTKLLPVVILTSSKEESDLAKGYSLGANSYIRKPVDFQQFTNTVAQLGLYWLVLNEIPPAPPPPRP